MHPLVREIRAALKANAHPARAPRMQAYMKSAMPYRGLSAPVLKKIMRDVLARHELGCEDRRVIARELFFDASYREERYAALAVTDHAKCQTCEAMPLYEEMIRVGAWWDLVDAIASHHIGDVLVADRQRTTSLLKKWARDPHLWIRRAAILCQLRRKAETDLDLLYACIEPNVADTDFFMRKAIGWALRQLAHTDPREVRRYVRTNRDRLSNLTVREALKNIGP